MLSRAYTGQCLSLLAHEIETKEQLALLAVQYVFFALDVSTLLRRTHGRWFLIPVDPRTHCIGCASTDMSGGSWRGAERSEVPVQPLLQVRLPIRSVQH
jgi:hypothetical protein